MRYVGIGAALLMSAALAMPAMAQTATGTVGWSTSTGMSTGTNGSTMSNGTMNSGRGSYGSTTGNAQANPLTAPHSGGDSSSSGGGGGSGAGGGAGTGNGK